MAGMQAITLVTNNHLLRIKYKEQRKSCTIQHNNSPQQTRLQKIKQNKMTNEKRSSQC